MRQTFSYQTAVDRIGLTAKDNELWAFEVEKKANKSDHCLVTFPAESFLRLGCCSNVANFGCIGFIWCTGSIKIETAKL